MRGDSTPFISSFNDYLTAILPICFGALNMTADEIRKSTPWEISQRIKGYEYRKRQERIFVGSFCANKDRYRTLRDDTGLQPFAQYREQ